MDGFSLDGIMDMISSMLPTLSYYLNMVTKLFDVFTSYLGIELTPEGTDEDTSTDALV